MEENGTKFTVGRIEGLENLKNDGFEEIYLNLTMFADQIDEEFESIFTAIYEKGLENVELLTYEVHQYSEYRDYYLMFVREFSRILNRSTAYNIVQFYEVDIEHFIQQAQQLAVFTYLRTNSKLRQMQQFCIMRKVTDFIYHLYLSFVNRNLPVFSYMQEGARCLGYTDKMLFGKMYSAMKEKNKLHIATTILNGLVGGNSTYPPCLFKKKGAGEEIAAADYPYTFACEGKKPIKIEPVVVHGNLQKVYSTCDCSIKLGLGEQAALFKMDGREDLVILSYAGTEPRLSTRRFHNLMTDVAQIFYGPETTYLAAVGLLLELRREVAENIKVVGHSLGGGLMQYAVTAVGDDRIYGMGFNSAGLSTYSRKTLGMSRIQKGERKIQHLCADTDYISPIGQQIGTVLHVSTGVKLSHALDDLNKTINGELMGCEV